GIPAPRGGSAGVRARPPRLPQPLHHPPQPPFPAVRRRPAGRCSVHPGRLPLRPARHAHGPDSAPARVPSSRPGPPVLALLRSDDHACDRSERYPLVLSERPRRSLMVFRIGLISMVTSPVRKKEVL